MHVLWLIRSDLEQQPGGDTTQILGTASALRRRGVSVDLSSDADADLSRYDLVHIFHLGRVWENAHWCELIREHGLPSVLSPIYWPTEEFDRRGRHLLPRSLLRMAGPESAPRIRTAHRSALSTKWCSGLQKLKRTSMDYAMGARFVIDTVDVLLPNSHAESQQIAQRFPSRTPMIVVPNGVDPETFSAENASGPAPRNSVLCVGRIEPRKNQLSLIRGLGPSGFPIKIAGQPGRYSRRYYRQCRRAAGENVEFLGHRSTDELRGWYSRSAVHVSPSWYETPGIASLEAASCGCRIVVTPGGCTREYFGENAEYCQPDDPGSIRRAVDRALARPADPTLLRSVAERFTWDVAAAKTIEGYEMAFKRLIRN